MEEEKLPVDKMVRIYIKMRDKKAEITAAYEQELADLEAQRGWVVNAIKEEMQSTGAKAIKTEYGTVSLITKTRYYTNDWDAFKSFVVEHDALDLFEKRIAQRNMETFLEDNPKLVPPGLNSESKFDISVRKA